jgi:hypothetical protein
VGDVLTVELRVATLVVGRHCRTLVGFYLGCILL